MTRTDTDDDARALALEAEERRAERWLRFENDCAEFADTERDGWAAVLRAVARAMAAQGELLR